jgi:PAS domain S-box-containing protein
MAVHPKALVSSTFLAFFENDQMWPAHLAEESRDLLCMHDLQGRLLSVNSAAARALGSTVEEVLSTPLRDLVDPKYRDAFDAYLLQIQHQGESRGRLAILTRNGERRIWEYHNTLRTEGLATPIVIGIAHDISEGLQARVLYRSAHQQLSETVREREVLLHESSLFRALLDQSNDAIEVVHPESMRYLDCNQKAYLDLGYTRDEFLSMTVFDVDPNLDRDLQALVLRELRQSDCFLMESLHRRKDGSTFPVEVNIRRVLLDREYVVAVARDITARKQVHEALRLSEARERKHAQELETVLEAVPVAVCIAHDPACQRMTGNLAAYREMRVEPGTNLSMSGPLESRPSFRLLRDGVELAPESLPIQQAIATGKPVLGSTLTMVFEDGVEREELVNAVPLLDESGNPLGAVGAAIDLTGLKLTERALRQSELRFRAVYERSPLGIALVDSTTGRFLEINPKFCEIAGRTEAELLRLDVAAITHPDDLSLSAAYLRQMIEERLPGYSIEKRYVRPDGTARSVQLHVVPMWDKSEPTRWHMALVQDLTEHRQSERAINTIAQQVRADSSDNFFSSMAISLAACLEADYTVIAQLAQHAPGIVHTIAICHHGIILENFTYTVANTPCSEVLAKGARSYRSGATELFPECSLLKHLKVEGYVGTPLRDSQGQSIGLMIALYSRPLPDSRFAEMILQLFSSRTAAEVQRKSTEEALRLSEERFRVALKNSPTSVFSMGPDLRYTWIHNSQLPPSNAEQVGKSASQVFHGEEAARITAQQQQVFETGVGVHNEIQITYEGRKHYFDSTVEPVLDAAGHVVSITGATTDVTASRETSDALRQAKKRLTEEKLYLEHEIDTAMGFGEIIGKSAALRSVMDQVATVATTEATVLLLGETGTGKELVARAIHHLSHRARNSFIKMNCAAIPSGLLESELFGNEKGAFTGAVTKKIGRLELADKGTLFLDEIGEISLTLQPKLLRVLQDREFERLGGIVTLKADFRLIAATNRDLGESVRLNQFRSDLYYRLHVFPIRIPPLRERREDIPLLVEHFVQKCAHRMRKSITSIPKRTMDTLTHWPWPGNIRELENFIERSVILTLGSVLVSPLGELESALADDAPLDQTLESAERIHILRALRDSHGKIGGLHGAAARLGLKRTTLQSKLKQFGISPRSGTGDA